MPPFDPQVRLNSWPDSGRRLCRRFYFLTVTSLAIFVTGFLLLREPIRGYRAAALFAATPTAASPEETRPPTLEEITAEVISPPFVRQALRATGVPATVALDEQSHRLSRQMQIRRATSPSNAASWFELSVVCRQPDEAVGVVRSLLLHLVATPSRISTNAEAEQSERANAAANAPSPVAPIRAQEEAARDALVRFVDEQFALLLRTASSTGRSAIGAQPTTAPNPAAAGDRGSSGIPSSGEFHGPKVHELQPASPEWTNLDRQLNAAQEERQRLLEHRTPEHPQVLQLEWQIERLKEDLDQVPGLVRADSKLPTDGSRLSTSPTDASASSSSEANLHSTPHSSGALGEVGPVAKQYRQLRQAYEGARRRLAEANQSDRNSRAESDSGRTEFTASIVEPARIISRLGGTISRSRLTWLAIVSLGSGIALVLLVGSGVGERVFTCGKQVQEHLGLVVVGRIANCDGRYPLSGWRFPLRLAGWLTRGCEAFLVILVLSFLMLALFDSPTTASFAADPLGTISEVAARAITF